jgi:hypothetical protein
MILTIIPIGSRSLILPNSYKHVFGYISWSNVTDSPSDCPLVTTLLVQHFQ